MSWRIDCCMVLTIVPSARHDPYHRVSSHSVAPTAGKAALDRSLAEAELLNDITVAAAGEEDLPRLLGAVLSRLRRVIRFTGGSIALIEGEDLVLRAAVGP